jgi:maltose O-acetyltransferase
MSKLIKIIRIILFAPIELISFFSLTLINMIPRTDLFDRIRFVFLRLHGVRGSGRFTILSPIEISPYCAQRRITINGPSFINSGIRLAVPMDARIIIEKNVAIGPRVQFECMNHGTTSKEDGHAVARGGIVHVEEGVWIGAGCIILGDVVIGEGSVVAAGSVVNRDVPPNTLVAGVPAIVKKSLK